MLGLVWVVYQGNIATSLWFDSTGGILKPLMKVTNGFGAGSYGMDTCQMLRVAHQLACATLGSSVAPLISCQRPNIICG